MRKYVISFYDNIPHGIPVLIPLTQAHKYHEEHFYIYGMDMLYGMFDPDLWEGYYIPSYHIYQNPEILEGVDLWLTSVQFDTASNPDFVPTINKLKAMGVTVVGEPDCGHSHNILRSYPSVREAWSNFDFIEAAVVDPRAVAALEHLYNVPVFGTPVPLNPDLHNRELEMSDNVDWDLPEGIEDAFCMSHLVMACNYMTVQIAEAFGIPLVINMIKGEETTETSLWAARMEMEGGYEHVTFCFNKSHNEWLYQMKNSRGVFCMSQYPSAGRPMMYSTLAGKLSLSTRTTWQEVLYPDNILPHDWTVGADWEKHVEAAQKALPMAQERLYDYTPERVQPRFEAFLQEHGFAQRFTSSRPTASTEVAV